MVLESPNPLSIITLQDTVYANMEPRYVNSPNYLILISMYCNIFYTTDLGAAAVPFAQLLDEIDKKDFNNEVHWYIDAK